MKNTSKYKSFVHYINVGGLGVEKILLGVLKFCDIKKMMLKQIRDEKYTAKGKDQIC